MTIISTSACLQMGHRIQMSVGGKPHTRHSAPLRSRLCWGLKSNNRRGQEMANNQTPDASAEWKSVHSPLTFDKRETFSRGK